MSAGVSYCRCLTPYEIKNIVETYGVTRVDITIIVEGGRFLLCAVVVLGVTVYTLRDEQVPDRADTFIKLRAW